jgi:D-glycero-alpha-D-manno-heptose-7-phosphate kinase
VEVRSEDQGVEEVWDSSVQPPAGTKVPLIAECVRFFEPERPLRLVTRCAAPAGAGLGGSSSLAISMLGGLQAFLNRPMMPPEEMVRVARDLEARVLGVPTGTQDHFAAAYGGVAAIRFGPGRPIREALAVDLERLDQRLVLAYGGASRASAMANWDMMRRAIENEGTTRAGLQAIASIAREMRGALIAHDLDAAGALMAREWEERQKLSPKVATPVLEKAIAAGRAAGALAGKVCGAGGGGCIAFLCKAGARDQVRAALDALRADGVRVLAARPTRVGLHMAG